MSGTIECDTSTVDLSSPSHASAVASSSPHDSDHATKKHMRGSSLLLAGRGLATLINFAVQVLVVRYLSVEAFGAFAFAIATVALLAKFAELGLGKGLSRNMAMYHEQGDHGRLFGALVLGLGTVLGVGGLLVLSVFAFRGVLAEHFVSSPVTLNVLLILVLLTPLQALEDVLEKTFAVFSRARALFFRRHLIGPLFKLLAVLMLVVFPGNVYVLTVGYVIASVVGVGISLMLLVRILRQQDLIAHFHWNELRIPAREVFGFSIPLISSDVAFLFRVSLVVFMLEMYFGSAAVAAFRAVFPVARMNMLVFDSFKTLYLPWASRLFARGDRAGLSELYWRNAAWLAVLSFPILLATIPFCGATTTLLFGDRYAASAPILAILSIGCFVQVVFGFGAMTLRVAGHVRSIVVIDVATALAAFGLALVLIPRFGAIGGALSASSTLILQNLLYQFVLARDETVQGLDGRFARSMAMILITAAGLVLFQLFVQPTHLIAAMVTVIASAAVLAMNVKNLQIAATFPELSRLPVVKHLLSENQTLLVREQGLKDHLSRHAGEYFGDLHGGGVQVRMRRLHERTNSTLYEFDLIGRNHGHRVLVKTPWPRHCLSATGPVASALPDRPRLCSKPLTELKSRFEFAALSTIERHFTETQDDRFAAVRMLDLLPDETALVMEKAAGTALNWQMLRASRLSLRPIDRNSLGPVFQNTGAWLRKFHELPSLPHTRSRCTTRAEFIESIERFTDYLSTDGRTDNWRHIRDVLTNEAMTHLPETLPLGLSHGDYAPRNVLSESCGRIRVIDTVARWRAPIYEDLARFIAAINVSQPQVWTFGLAFKQRDLEYFSDHFLKGYFGEESVPVAQIRLFECQAHLERLGAIIHRFRGAAGWKRNAKHVRKIVWNLFVKRQILDTVHSFQQDSERSGNGDLT